MARPRILCIVGPTASGKSALAVQLAGELDSEIISADSMQVYKYMDIGTAKPTIDERGGVPHHLIDVVNPNEDFSASDFKEKASELIRDISGRGKTVIVAGGTGLYIRALTKGLVDTPEGDPLLRAELQEEVDTLGTAFLHDKLKKLDPDAAESIHPNNVVRIIRAIEVALKSGRRMSDYQRSHGFGESIFDVMMVGVELERDLLYGRIEERVDRMIETGLVDEVEKLLHMGYGRELKPMGGVGYKEICAHILDGIPLEKSVELIKRDSRRYAKRQMTWFRKEAMEWIKPEAFLVRDRVETVRCFLRSDLK